MKMIENYKVLFLACKIHLDLFDLGYELSLIIYQLIISGHMRDITVFHVNYDDSVI